MRLSLLFLLLVAAVLAKTPFQPVDLRKEDKRIGLESVLQYPTKVFGFTPPTLDQIKQVRKMVDNTGVAPKANWAKSGNVAQYNGIKIEPYLTVPINLNIIFIGFEGDGHHGLKVDESQLKQWFSHLEHKMEHVRMNSDESTTQAPPTHIYYDYHYRVIEFSPDVNTVLEAIIWDNARPENPWSSSADDPEAITYFIDVTTITDVLDTITDSLALDESYTLFVLNPKLPHAGFRYGYRYGFSNAEMMRLRESLGLVMELQKRNPPRPLPDFPDIILADAEDHKAGSHINSTMKYQMASLRNQSKEWADLYMLQMHELSYWQRHPLEEVEGQDNKKDDPLPPPRDVLFEVTATKLLQSQSPADKEYIRSVLHEPFATPNCLVDTWVSDKRYAFIDLSAGPFNWGPVVGGEGVRTQRTLPNVADISVAMRDFSVGGKWNNTAYIHKIEKQFRKHGVEILQKEQEILLRFLEEHCNGNQESEGEIRTCKNLRHELSSVEAYLIKHKGEKSVDPKVIQHLSLVAGGPHEGPQEGLVLQSFFAKLGNIVRGLQRHVITPPLSSLPAPYAAHVKFHVYLIRNHNEYKPDDVENFDFSEFKRQMDEFALPRQKFVYTITSHTLSDDYGLAMAYARSLRSAVVGTLRANGQFVSSKRLYLDSVTLEEHLRALHSHFQEAEPEIWSETAQTRTVPIFIFSLDYPMPVLVDKYHQARAMSDMVLAVQSDDVDWESHIGCGGHHVRWNLRNPLRAVLSATAQHLTGIIPSHRGVNEATGKPDQNWLWSVGSSAQALTTTSPGNFSLFAIDAAQRGYVLSEMSEALILANSAVVKLRQALTGAGSERIFGAIPNDKIVQSHIAFKQAIHKCAEHIRLLDFTGAIPVVHAAKRTAKHLLGIANDVHGYLNIDHCLRGDAGKGHAPKSIDWSLWSVMALAMISLAAYLLYKPERGKPKLV